MLTKNELKDISIFSDLDEMEAEIITSLLEQGKYAAEEIIFQEGDACQGIFLIRQGAVQLRKLVGSGQSILIKVSKAGEIIEPLSWLNMENEVNHYSAITLRPTETLLLGKWQINFLAEKYPALLYKIMKNFSCRMASRLNQAQMDLVDAEQYLEGGTYT